MKYLILPLILVALQDDPKQVQVVTTLGYLRYVAQQIGGDRVNAVSLAPAGRDPHYVVATPALQKKAGKAHVFALTGRGLELWAKNVVNGSGNTRIQLGGNGYLLATTSCSIEELPKEVSREWGDLHPEGNPHVWLDPLNMKIVAANFAETLTKVDSDGAKIYRKNLEAFQRRLAEALFGKALVDAVGMKRIARLERRLKSGDLEEYLKRKRLLAKLGGWLAKAKPIRGAKVVTYHKTYVYFAKRFGLKIVGELEERPGIPPSPGHRDAIVKLVKSQGVKVILNDNFYPLAAADYIARKTGAKVVVTYIDVGASEEVSDYFGLIDRMLDGIVEAAK